MNTRRLARWGVLKVGRRGGGRGGVSTVGRESGLC